MIKCINNVIELVVKTVNSIRSKETKRCIFRELTVEVDFHCGYLLLHSNIRWLIKGKVLHRFVELLPFFQKNGHIIWRIRENRLIEYYTVFKVL